MTKPEFDKLYNEKIARGLDFPLNDLLEKINETGNYKKTSDILGHILAHEMATNILGEVFESQTVHVSDWKMEGQSNNPKISLVVRFDIYDNSTI